MRHIEGYGYRDLHVICRKWKNLVLLLVMVFLPHNSSVKLTGENPENHFMVIRGGCSNWCINHRNGTLFRCKLTLEIVTAGLLRKLIFWIVKNVQSREKESFIQVWSRNKLVMELELRRSKNLTSQDCRNVPVPLDMVVIFRFTVKIPKLRIVIITTK